MAGENDIQGTADPRLKDAKGGTKKKPVPDPGKTTNTDGIGVQPGVPGKRTNTDGMVADGAPGVGKQTQVDANDGKDKDGLGAKDAKGGGGGGGGGGGKQTDHPGAVDEKQAKDKKGAGGGDKKNVPPGGGKDGTTGKKDGKQGDALAVKGGKDEKSAFYVAKPVIPADRVDVSPMPTIGSLRVDAPKTNKNLDDKWRKETGRTPTEHHTQIQAELQKLDADVQRMTTELQSTVDRHVTKVTSEITKQVEGFKSTLIAPGRARVEAAYAGLGKGFEDAEKTALEQIKKHKATGLAQIREAKARNQQTLDAKFKDAKGLTTGMVTKYVPVGAKAIKDFATGIPAYVKEAKTLANQRAQEAAQGYKPESFMNATDMAGGLKALAEEVKKQHALNHGKKLGAQYEATLMGWGRNADKKAEEVVKAALLSSQTEFEAALDIASKGSQTALTEAEKSVTGQLDTQETSATTAVTTAKTNGIKRFDTEKTAAITAADQAGKEFTDNTTNAGTELTDRLKKKASDDAKSYQAVVADLQKQLKSGVPQKYEQVQPKIESARQQLTKAHNDNITSLDKLVTDGSQQLTETVTKQQQIYTQAITDRENGAKKLQTEVIADIGKSATEMGASLANIGKTFSDTTTRESQKVDFAISEFQKGADAALKDFGAKVKQQLETERAALYDQLKVSTNPETMKKEAEGEAAAEVAAKQKSIDKDATALRAAMDGWGTAEGKIFEIMRKLGHGEITYLHAVYNDHFKHRAKNGKTALVYDLEDELSGNELQIAMGYLNHNREAAIKLELADSVGFWNDDEKRIEDILRNCDQKEIEHLNTNAEAKAVVADVKKSLGGADLDVMNTLLDKDVDKADRENKANAIRLYDAMDGLGTDEAKMKQILEGAKTPEERLKLRAAFNQYAASKGAANADGGAKGEQDDALTNMIKGDTSGGEEAVMLTLAKTDQTKTELAAAKLYQGADGGGTDEDQIFEALDDEEYAARWKAETDPKKRAAMEVARKAQLDKDLAAVSNGEHKTVDGLIDGEMSKGKLTWEELESGTKKDGTKVSAAEKIEARGYLEWMVAQRKLQSGQCEPELLIAYACFGDGTNEELIQKALSKGGDPLSIAETSRINTKFNAVFGQPLVTRHELLDIKWGNAEKTKTGPAPGGMLNNELSGKDWNKTRQLMCGKPETAEQLKYLSALRGEYATSGFLGGALMELGEAVGYTDTKSDAEAQQKRFDEAYAASFKNNPTAKLADTKEGQELERLGDYLAADYEAYSSALNALVDGIVTAIEIVGAIVITVLTAGTSAPVLMAVLYNLALSATTIVFKAAALGDQYGAAELGTDIVKAAGNAAFAGIGEMKAIANITQKAGNAGAAGINRLAQLGDTAIAKAGVKMGGKGLLEMTPQSVDKLSKIIAAGTKNVILSSGQEVYNTLTDEKTYSMKLEDIVWGENSLGKKLLMGAPKAFASGAVTQWINGISGVSNRDNVGRLKKPFPNALGNMLAEMGGATAGFFAYLDNYQDAEKFWKGLLQANAQAGISGFAQGVAMHKTRAKRSGRDFINGELTAEGLMELHKSLDPSEVADLAQFVEKYGGKDMAARLPDEFRAQTSVGGKKTVPVANQNVTGDGTSNGADANSTTTVAGDDETNGGKTPKKPGEDDLQAKKKQDEELARAEAKRKQDEAEAERRKQQDAEAEAQRKQREADEAKRRQEEAEAAAKKKESDEREAERRRQVAEEEAARKKAEQEAAAKKQAEEAELKRQRDEAEAAARKKQAEEDEAYRLKQAEEARQRQADEEAAYRKKEADEAALKRKQEEEMWAKRAEDERRRQQVTDDEDGWLSTDEPLGRTSERDKKRRKRLASDDQDQDTLPEDGTDMSDRDRRRRKDKRLEDKQERLDAEQKAQQEVADRRRLAELVELATQAHAEYGPKIEEAKALLKSLIGDLGEVQGRAKDPESAANRLQRAEKNFGAQITDVASAKDNLWDALGTRIVLSGKPDEVAQVMRKLAEAVAAGKLKIVQSNSNHGDGVAPYMTQADIDMLAAASGGAMEHGAGEVRRAPADKSAFTSGLIFVQYPDGTRGEIQIIGKKVLEVAAIEHIPYDISIGKPLVRGLDEAHTAEMKKVTGPIEAAIQALDKDPAKKVAYDQYLRELYIHARNAELGIDSPPPKLPAGIDQALSAQGLRQVYDQIEAIKAKAKAAQAEQTGTTPKKTDPEGGGETAVTDAASRKVDDGKLKKLDELAARLKSDDEQVRLRAQAELDGLRADPEWKDALKLKDDVFGTAKKNQKVEGEDLAMLSDNIPTLLAEADKARVGKNPVLQAKRDKFERALALAILADGPVRAAVDAELARLCEKAFDYLSRTRQGADLDKAVGGLGLDAKKGYGGGVGQDVNVMMDVLANGNIRERMIALASFMEMIGKDALSETGRKKLQGMAEGTDGQQPGTFTAEDARRLVERTLAYTEGTDAKDQSVKGLFNPTAEEAQAGGKHEAYASAKKQDMDTKLPPLVAAKVAEFLGQQVYTDPNTGLTRGAEGSPLARTTITVEEAIRRGLQLSDREIEAAGGLQAPLNWVVGQRANIVDPKAKFIADAKQTSMPLKAGISGTTYRWMMMVEILGGDPKLARLAAIASLQAADAHSYHEIATAARGFGAEYDPSQPYAHVGLDRATLEAIARSAGTTLDELNGTTADDKTGQ